MEEVSINTSTVNYRKRGLIRHKRIVESIAFLAPLSLLFLAFMAWPIIWTLILAFSNMKLTGVTALHWHLIGFANFAKLFTSSEFLKSTLLSFVFLFGSAYLGQCVLGFFLALLMQKRKRWVRAFVGGAIILAWVIPEIVAAFMWYALLTKGGVAQSILGLFHIHYQTWLISHPMLSVSIANSWRGVAFSMMLFTAALSNIPPELNEAAEVDGASGWWKVTRVVIPMIKQAVIVDLVLITLATLNDFTLIYAMTGGGPGNNSEVLSVFMYQRAFSDYDFAYGAAISVVLLAIGAIFSLLYIRAIKDENE